MVGTGKQQKMNRKEFMGIRFNNRVDSKRELLESIRSQISDCEKKISMLQENENDRIPEFDISQLEGMILEEFEQLKQQQQTMDQKRYVQLQEQFNQTLQEQFVQAQEQLVQRQTSEIRVREQFDGIMQERFDQMVLQYIRLKKRYTQLQKSMDLIQEQFDETQVKVEEIQKQVEEGFTVDLVRLLNEMQEKTHTDFIKLYRNLQAVIVEENARQNKVIVDTANKTTQLKRKVNVVLLFSIVSLVASIGIIAMQILPKLGIHLF